MPQRSLSEALGRALVATAWTDGELSREERRAMEDLLFSLPDLSIDAWRQLEHDMAQTLDETERQNRIHELQERIGSEEDLEMCRSAMQTLAGRASPLGQSDRDAINQLLEDLVAPPSEEQGILGRISGWLSAPLRQRAQANADHATRNQRFREDVRDHILTRVRERLGWNPNATNISEEKLNRLCLVAALLARVANADDHIDDSEFETIRDLLKERLDGDALSASIVTEILIGEVTHGLDTYALAREFFDATTEREKLQLLDLMFAVAAADGHVASIEMEEIRIISQTLLLSHRQFIDAKLKIPKASRDS